MIESIIAALPVSIADRRSTHGATLIRSACETLAQTSPGLIAAVTVSVPADGLAQITWLRATARSLAAEYGFDVAVAVEEHHISVRLTRRQDCRGSR